MPTDRTRKALGVLKRFPKASVLVVGDLMLDQFIWGRVERISPEAPVPVVQVVGESFHLGGAANVVHNIIALGGRAAACGVVGDDPPGKRICLDLRAIGADTTGVFRDRHVPTTQKVRVIAHQQQVVRFDRERLDGGKGRAVERARQFLLRNLGTADAVVLSDYGKGVIDESLLAALAERRRQCPFCLVVDPKERNFAFYRNATVVTPNREEASRAAGIAIHDEATLHRAGQILLERWESEAVLITRGEQGMTLFRRGRPPVHFPTVARHVFDVTGAGDTVVATIALALAAGADLETAAVLANHAAGVVVGEVGTATVDRGRLRAELRRAAQAPDRRRA